MINTTSEAIINPAAYGTAVKHISKIGVDEWPKEKKIIQISGIYSLEMWTELDGCKWAVLVDTTNTKNYRILKREKSNV